MQIASLSAHVSFLLFLHVVSGAVYGGSLMAIMGASGSGKTTLLQILAGQRHQTSGEVCLNVMRLRLCIKMRTSIYLHVRV